LSSHIAQLHGFLVKTRPDGRWPLWLLSGQLSLIFR
jgi:hypothetical protein